MNNSYKVPEFHFSIGQRSAFAIDVVLPWLSIEQKPSDLAAVLEITDGYLTFFVAGTNIFQVETAPTSTRLLSDYTSLSLSMVLEWILFDKAYRVDTGTKMFSDIIAGESSPAVTFELVQDGVEIGWDLKTWKRCGAQYKTPVGSGKTGYIEYLICLASIADNLIAATEWRAACVGRIPEWHQWLSGYRAELNCFKAFVMSQLPFGNTGAALR